MQDAFGVEIGEVSKRVIPRVLRLTPKTPPKKPLPGAQPAQKMSRAQAMTLFLGR